MRPYSFLSVLSESSSFSFQPFGNQNVIKYSSAFLSFSYPKDMVNFTHQCFTRRERNY